MKSNWPAEKRENEKMELKEGSLVFLHPDMVSNKAFAGCIMTVTEPKSWGAVGYIQGVGDRENTGEEFYYTANLEEFEYIGHSPLYPPRGER